MAFYFGICTVFKRFYTAFVGLGFLASWLLRITIWLQMDTDMDNEEFSTTRLQKKRCKRKRSKDSLPSSLSDFSTSSSSEDDSSKRTALLVQFEGKGPGSIRFGQGLRRLKLIDVPIVSRISDTKFKIVVASASDASVILKCSNRRFTPEEWKVSGESFQITSFEERKRQLTYSFVIKNVETCITIKDIEQELKLQLTDFKVTRILSAKTWPSFSSYQSDHKQQQTRSRQMYS